MSDAKRHKKGIEQTMIFPAACEFVATMASWNLDDIIHILNRLSIADHFDIDYSHTHDKNHKNKWNVSFLSPLLFRSTTVQTLQQLLVAHKQTSTQLTLNDLDFLLNTNTSHHAASKSELIRGDITDFILFLIYFRCFHSHFENPYLSAKYTQIINNVNKQSVSQYLLDISCNFSPFITLLLNHQIRFKPSQKDNTFNADFIHPLNRIIDIEFQIKQFMSYPIQCINRISNININTTQATTTHEDMHPFIVLLMQYAAFEDDDTLMSAHRLNQHKLMFIISNLSIYLHQFAMKTNNKYLLYFIAQRSLYIVLRYIRYHHAIDSQTNTQNVFNLNQLKPIFLYLLEDKDHILDTNLHALIFMISSHTLITKLMDWKFIDYSSLKGHKQRMEQMKSKGDPSSDIGYIFECCLNNGKLSLFNHNVNVAKHVVIYYIHQCLLYLSPHTFNVHELIHILLSYINIPSTQMVNTNHNEFDEEFFTSYCILFRSIAENIDKMMKIAKTECTKTIQTLCLTDIIIYLSETKQEFVFKNNEIFFIGYVCALCGISSTNKSDISTDNEWKETEMTLNTEIQTEISYVIGHIQSAQNISHRMYPGSASQILSWGKSIMSACGILCNFNEYFAKTEYITLHSFYFMDFMFDTLLQTLVDLISSINKHELFVSYLNQTAFTVSKLMQITAEHKGSFTSADINKQQYKMIQDISKYIHKYIWNKDKDELTQYTSESMKYKGIIWYCALQILSTFSVIYWDLYPEQMIAVSISTVQMEHIAYPHATRTQLIKKISTAISRFPEQILMPFLSRIKLIYFANVEDNKCCIPISGAYKSRDTMIVHILTECIDKVSEKPSVLSSHIVPYLHLYGNNELINDKQIISRLHHLYSLTVQYLSLRWEYFDISKDLYYSTLYDNYYRYYFEKLLIANLPTLIDYATLAQSFNITFSFDIKQKVEQYGMESEGALSKLGNVVFTDNKKNNRLSHFNGESMADLFNALCIDTMSKMVYHVLDNLSIRYQFGEHMDVKPFEAMIINMCKLVMVCNCMDNMIKLKDLNYGLFLCKKLLNVSMIKNNINTQNQVLMRRILVTFSDIISKCNNLTRKDHCLKWYFDLTDDIDWNSKL